MRIYSLNKAERYRKAFRVVRDAHRSLSADWYGVTAAAELQRGFMVAHYLAEIERMRNLLGEWNDE